MGRAPIAVSLIGRPHHSTRRSRRASIGFCALAGCGSLARMFGFLGIFGRSRELRQLDQAVRAVGLHPRLIPDAVQLTAVKLLAETDTGRRAYDAAAEMLAYCMLGPHVFTGDNGADLTAAVETRLEAAFEAGDSLDARLVLLALHAGVIQPQVVERYRLEAG